MINQEDIFSRLEYHKYDDSCCFLCGIELDEANKTKEHVIPKWIQRRFNLWNQKIILLNNTSFEYRYLTIPCCNKCNNEYLKLAEDEIKKNFSLGIKKFIHLNKDLIYYWLAKIFFGLMYKELFLLYDQKSPNQGNIVSKDYIANFKNLHLFLQGLRKEHSFNGFVPYSIFVVETQIPNKKEKQWDFIDNHNSMIAACRLGEIGIICVFQDGGTLQNFKEELSEFFAIPLHPIQFRELVAKVTYKTMLLRNVPTFISTKKDDKIETSMFPIGGLSQNILFDEWNNDEYAKVLSKITNLPLNRINPQPGMVWSWMKDNEGNPLFIGT